MRLWKTALAAISVLVFVIACQPAKPPPPGGGGGGGGGGSGGNGFDACTAPSTSAMSAWLQSPYRFVGVYIGGVNRACAQPNLTASWVETVHGQGFGLIPTYVGDQAWCTSASDVIVMPQDLTGARNRGQSQGLDAANQAGALGLGPGTPIYFDMEAYDTSAAGCTDSVRAFMSGWIAALHDRGYVAAMYSSSASGVRDMANVQSDPTYQLDAIWFANWNGNPSLVGDPFFPDSVWQNARIHQFQGGHDESWGGVTINIDSDAVGGPTG